MVKKKKKSKIQEMFVKCNHLLETNAVALSLSG